MLETFAALFAAHVTADYLAQTRDMVENKHKPGPMARHIAIVALFSVIAIAPALSNPQAWLAIAVLTGIHAAMDLAKTHILPGKKLWPYLLDQVVHIGTIIAIAATFPMLAAEGLWATYLPAFYPYLTQAYLLFGFAVFAVVAGGYAVQILLAQVVPTEDSAQEKGMPDAGRAIGRLERGIILLLMLIGQPAGIAFLIAAKSVLRFGDVQQNRPASEIVIIGTLASVGWAMLCGVALLALLPDGTLETWGLTAYLGP